MYVRYCCFNLAKCLNNSNVEFVGKVLQMDK